MRIILDEVQANILLRLIKQQSINQAERRELISIEIQLQEHKDNEAMRIFKDCLGDSI